MSKSRISFALYPGDTPFVTTSKNPLSQLPWSARRNALPAPSPTAHRPTGLRGGRRCNISRAHRPDVRDTTGMRTNNYVQQLYEADAKSRVCGPGA